MVKSVNRNTLKVKPMSSITVTGVYRSKSASELTAVTEICEGKLSDSIVVCPRVVNLEGSSCKIPLRIFNMTAKVVHIKPRSVICILSEANTVRHAELDEKVVSEKKDTAEEKLCNLGINIKTCLSNPTRDRLVYV